MKTLIYLSGSAGLVGSRFVELYSHQYQLLTPEIGELDITNLKSVKDFFRKNSPEVVINFAAFTDVGQAEEQRDQKKDLCWQVNVEGTKNLVANINSNETRFIQISTDMVFPGSAEDPGPYPEDHQPETDPNKLTWYGYTKAEAEREVLKVLGKKAVILRLIYPVRAKYAPKLDYLRKPLQLFTEGKLYPMFVDQQVSISFIDEICLVLEKIIEQKRTGVFHASSRNTTTPYKLISYSLEKTKNVKNAVHKGSLKEFLKKVENPVRYPLYGGLKVEKTEKKLGFKFSTWQEIVDQLVKQGVA